MSEKFVPELTFGNEAAAAEEITLTLGDAPATPATPEVEEKKPDFIVLGYPLLLNGDAGERAQICEEFAEVLPPMYLCL